MVMAANRRNENFSSLKRGGMTLDLDNGPLSKKKPAQNVSQLILGTPDIQRFILSTPEVENMLHNQMNSTPTPTRVFFPPFVNQEQEEFAQGFVEALEKVKQGESQPLPAASVSGVTLADPLLSATTTASTVGSPTTLHTLEPPRLTRVKEEPQTVPSCTPPPPVTTAVYPFSPLTTQNHHQYHMTTAPNSNNNNRSPANGLRGRRSMGGALGQQLNLGQQPTQVSQSGGGGGAGLAHPIRLEDQERLKVERKRARNRLAAQKCRQRKMERIQELEEQVAQLKSKNSDLQRTAQQLRAEVQSLRQTVGGKSGGGGGGGVGGGVSSFR